MRVVDEHGRLTAFMPVLDSRRSYGEVYSALDTRSNEVVAIKVRHRACTAAARDGRHRAPPPFPQVIPLDADMSDMQKEIDILRKCHSPYVVSYRGSFAKDGDLWVCMDYCAAGSVADLMTICELTLLEDEIADVAAATLLGLEYLHSIRLIHRDLKAGNILLAEDGAAKLADFGVSAQLGSSISKRKSVIGTP